MSQNLSRDRQVAIIDEFVADLRATVIRKPFPPDVTPYDIKNCMADVMKTIAEQGSTCARKRLYRLKFDSL